MPLALLKGISKRYHNTVVLDRVDLSLEEGEFVALIGRSGSGKSTLLRILGGLEPPDAGSVEFAGKEITMLSEQGLSEFRRRALGFVFQSFNLVETLTVAENAGIPLYLNGYDHAAVTARVDELLSRLGIVEHADKFPDALSGGEQQRAAIARALAHHPRLVIADEPTGNLDDQTAESVMELLVHECRSQRAGLIVATHSDEVSIRSNRTIQLVGGNLETLR
ncbi:MAG: ABC transporter ATP-binding protein [Gammaproteobacteria bacterium]|jgi:putative ABC transport system ATP-binding protein